MEQHSHNVYKISELVKPCIYLLLRSDRVVYVGQSTMGFKRILNHYPEKNFDSIIVVDCSKENLNETEIEYIVKYQPEYNINLSNTTSIKQFKYNLQKVGCRVWVNDIKRYLYSKHKEKLLTFKGAWYVSNKYAYDLISEMVGFFNNN